MLTSTLPPRQLLGLLTGVQRDLLTYRFGNLCPDHSPVDIRLRMGMAVSDIPVPSIPLVLVALEFTKSGF
ncbi:hypothetical protein NDU88_004975 [Pleurodeles waltl]|uniref:Uncharacterized protein n=1 Tax=Pleurodeles waltl TaxID=8319 RepID=A0AAV7SKF8_PLEWA|nr:hypothetical protein NDU88_004975 [Pleurodeles waltl]